jgi:threonyl-tRNA synthetase
LSTNASIWRHKLGHVRPPLKQPSQRNREDVVSAIRSRWVTLQPDGSVKELDRASSGPAPPADAAANSSGLAAPPSHRDGTEIALKAMRQLGWADYEPTSDNGHLRFYPNGTLVFKLLRDWQEDVISELFDPCEIRTPLIYDWSAADVRGEAETFHDRLYYVYHYHKRREFVLRFGGDFGLFSLLKDLPLSYRNFPIRFSEFATSFRCDRSGELKGLHRTREFSFFDIHSLSTDSSQAWEEYSHTFMGHVELARRLSIDYVLEFSVVESTFRDHKSLILGLVAKTGKPALVELLSAPKHYWSIKHAFREESGNKLFNAQLDWDNSARYNITYTGKDGHKKHCVICHSSLGSIERWMFLTLERAARSASPSLPLWLAPTQVRLVPVAPRFESAAVDLCSRMADQRVRADVDDRNKTLAWKIRHARLEWIPYVICLGEREVNSGLFSLTSSGDGIEVLSFDAIIDKIRSKTASMPYRRQPCSRLSKGPLFASAS